MGLALHLASLDLKSPAHMEAKHLLMRSLFMIGIYCLIAGCDLARVAAIELVTTDFTYSASNDGFVPTTFSFTNKSSSNATQYVWNFGDPGSGSNNTSSSKDPSHTFTTPGTYILTLTATTADGISETKRDTITLKYRTFALQYGAGAGESVFQTADGGYLLSFSTGWIKVDPTGKEQWRYTPNVTSFDTPKAVQTESGDFYLAYTHILSSISKQKIRLVRLNSNGNFIKQQDVNSTEAGEDYLGDLIVNRTKELILYGVFYRGNANTTTKYEAKHYKVDNALTNAPSPQSAIQDFFPISNVSLIHASDGSYIGAQSIFVLFAINQNLVSIGTSTSSYKWNLNISDASGLADVIQAPGGNIITVGRKKTGTPHLSKHTLGTGALENAKDFGYASSSFTGVVNSTDNQLVTCGNGDVFLCKINANDLKEIWRKPSSTFSGSSASGIANTKDGGYIIVGTIKVGPNSNVHLIKTDQNGEL